MPFKVSNSPQCPYCGGDSLLTSSKTLYGTDFGQVYICENYPSCDAYVGVHKGTIMPKGSLANSELRFWRKEAHNAFDRLWQKGKMSRKQAYRWLKNVMNISKKKAHIAMFNIEQCKKLIEIIHDNKV